MAKNGKPDKDLPEQLPPQLPPLVKPAHGNGLLYRGGVPGHDGSNAGREADIVKAIAREHFKTRIPRLGRLADGTETMKMTVVTQAGPMEVDVKPNFGQQIKAHEVLAANAGLNDKEAGGIHLQVNIVGGGLALIKVETGGNGHA